MKPIANHITVMYRTAVSCLQTICYYIIIRASHIIFTLIPHNIQCEK